MADQVLTDARRSELAELLNDEQRLNSEYPKLAEYLDMAPQLIGTGNAKADAAFDLRMVHYMVGGNVNTINPYWDIVGPSVSEHEGRRFVNGGQSDGSARLAYAQMLLQAVYAYAVPSPETIHWMKTACEGRPILEIGAGRGYWAAQLAQAGLTVRAFDSEPPDSAENISFPQADGQRDVWHEVQQVRDLTKCVEEHADHALLLCWPPGWGNPMAIDTLRAFENVGGETVVFIGQSRGGMNATDEFFDSLSEHWTMTSEDAKFVSWWNLRDVAQKWTRR